MESKDDIKCELEIKDYIKCDMEIKDDIELKDDIECDISGNTCIFPNQYHLASHLSVYSAYIQDNTIQKEKEFNNCQDDSEKKQHVNYLDEIETLIKEEEKPNFGKRKNDEELTNNSIKLTCLICNVNFRKLWEYNKHMSEIHGKILDPKEVFIPNETKKRIRFRCSYCNKGFPTKQLIKIHERIHTGEKPYGPCEFCSQMFQTAAVLKRHIKVKHLQKHRVSCEYCDATFGLQATLNKHLAEYHKLVLDDNLVHACDCGKVFYHLGNYRTHLLTHSGEKPYGPCEKCGKMFQTGALLTRHKRSHSENDKRFNCPICSEGFNHESTFNRHKVEIHNLEISPKSKFVCEICEKICYKKGDLKDHMFTHTGEKRPNVKKYSCVYCGKMFLTNNHRIVHERIHTGEKPIGPCKVCGEYFQCTSRFKRHLAKHNENPKLCEICGESFLKQHLLLQHLSKSHSLEIPPGLNFPCEFCEKTFFLKDSLNKHRKTKHCDPVESPSDLNFHCEYCEKVFTRKDSLNKHRKRNHCDAFETPSGLNFPCDVCEKVFTVKDSLNKHRKRKHSDCNDDNNKFVTNVINVSDSLSLPLEK